jgi:hypothetical protein
MVAAWRRSGAQEVLAIIDEIDGRDTAQVGRLGTRLPLQPTAEFAEIVEVTSGRDRGEVLRAERANAPSSASPSRGRFRSIERIVNPLLSVPVYCVQYTTPEAPDCVQDHLYALIDRKNRLQHTCFAHSGPPASGDLFGRNRLAFDNDLKRGTCGLR